MSCKSLAFAFSCRATGHSLAWWHFYVSWWQWFWTLHHVVVTQGLFEVLNFALLDYGLQEVLSFCGGGFGRSTNYYFGGSFGAPTADTFVIRFLAGCGYAHGLAFQGHAIHVDLFLFIYLGSIYSCA